ncbi:MAG: DUF58 domain-containing protein [Anaerolineales bacterium]|nr:DUF58 domain-containing protein [Anaerolineales bacterium]
MDLRRWLPLFLIGILMGVVLRVDLLVTFLVMLLIVLSLATWWKKHSLDGVTYLRKPHFRRAFPGETVPLRVEIENHKFLPLTWLRVQDPWPKAVGPDDEDILAPTHLPTQGLLTHVFSLRWYERARRYYTLKFRKRGVYQVGPVRLESGDLFGIFEHSIEVNPPELLTVFPELVPFADLQLPADDPFGDRRSRRRLYEDQNQPIGVRDYMPEDSFRKVHWPATAHTGQLQVKVFQPTSANIMMVCLNVSTFARHWEGTNPELFEHVIKVAATLVTKGIEDGYRVGLIANGCLAHADQPFRIPPGRSPKQLASLLEALAGVTPVVTGPFENFLIRQVPRVSYGATLLIVTSVTNPELFETLLQIKKRGRRITLLSFAQKTPQQVPGVRTIHLPFYPAAVN